jgi:cyclopropane fatty-acyl-phospholipid synthase-like methyltransferase
MTGKIRDLLSRIELRHKTDASRGDWCDFPWNDPRISERVLALHLDPDEEKASRPHAQIQAETAFLDNVFRDALGKPARVCDLTCGPGLYAMRLAELGHRVTGVDYSPAAIVHAQAEAARRGLDVRFIQEDVQQVVFPAASFDAAMIVYGQANAFPAQHLEDLLRRVRQWSSPEAVLVLDLASRCRLMSDLGRSWSVRETSVFSDRPHLWLEEKVYSRRHRVQTHEVITVDFESERVESFCTHHAVFELPDLEQLLRAAGWRIEMVFGDLTGSPYDEDQSTWQVPVARAIT